MDTGKSKGNPSCSAPWNELSSMGLFTGATIFDALDDDFDLHWDLASPALHDSEFTSIGCLDVSQTSALMGIPLVMLQKLQSPVLCVVKRLVIHNGPIA